MGAVWLVALPVLAQPNISSRCLFIFDTSSAMKKRLPALTNQIDNLFFSGLRGQLQPGDSIGVWVFNRELRFGQIPLQKWSPGRAYAVADNLKSLVMQESYSKTTQFGVLQPYLGDLVQNSERLTVFIFTDGDGQFVGTPYDADINAVFKQNFENMRKAKEPFVLVLRAQLGKFTGAVVSMPPGTVGLPQFPPLPSPPASTNAHSTPTVQAPPPVEAPLIIVGTRVGTNPPPPGSVLEPIAPLPTTVVQEKSSPATVTNIVNITNFVVVEVKSNPPPASTITATNTAATPPGGILPGPANLTWKTNEVNALSSMDSTGKLLAVVGFILLVVAGGLVVIFIMRSRHRNQASLITQTLNKKP